MNTPRNSVEMWDKFWKGWDRTASQLPGSNTLEYWYRKYVYFFAFNALLDSVPLLNQDILELGSGVGKNSMHIAKRYSVRSATLLDFNEYALRSVRDNDFPCMVIKTRQNLLHFSPEKQYGFVHSTGLIEHFMGKERLAVVQKHEECVKPGGYVMIWVPIQSPAFSVIAQANKLQGIEEVPLTKKELKSLCAQSGLNVIGENTSVFGALFGVLAQKI